MAMPRFDGGTSLTSSPSMWSSPPVISSSPAIMRSSVDLPQPDGPTKTTNSPVLMSRSMPWSTSTGAVGLATSCVSCRSAMFPPFVTVRPACAEPGPSGGEPCTFATRQSESPSKAARPLAARQLCGLRGRAIVCRLAAQVEGADQMRSLPSRRGRRPASPSPASTKSISPLASAGCARAERQHARGSARASSPASPSCVLTALARCSAGTGSQGLAVGEAAVRRCRRPRPSACGSRRGP